MALRLPPGRIQSARARRRRPAGRWRPLGAAVSVQSLLASGLAPVTGIAAVGAAAAVVAASASSPAKASLSGSVLILSTSVNGGSSSAEAQQASALGLTVTVASASAWDAMTTTQFKAYSAIVIGDPSGSSCSTAAPSDALSTASTWGAAVTGNVAVLGTAPALGGATSLISDAIAYAASGSGTGLYVSLNCEYSTAAAGSGVPLLASVNGGGFTVTGQGTGCPGNAGSVNAYQALALSPFNGLKPSNLGPWSSPACAVQETFGAWPAGLGGLGYLSGASPALFTASDGETGQAYILAGAPASAATSALAPSTGGEVPQQATAGGTNPAAPAITFNTAGDPVDTENGDFSQSSTDLSIPTFGPSLDFTRTYDAQVAQQQTQTGTPGPMGYGWTDNWASSLSTASPVVGDVYSLDGLATPNGNGGPATGGPLDFPDMSILSGGNIYISDTAGNRIEEIPASTGTQWGIPMTAGDVYTIAGSPTGAYEVHPTHDGTPNENGPNGPSLLNHPEGIAFDASGNMYIADTGDNRVAEIPVASGTQWGISMTADDVYNVAGNSGGNPGHIGDGSAATSAFLDAPVGLDIGRNGADLYIADSGNNRIQEVPAENGGQWGQTSMTANDMYTVAGSPAGTPGASPNGTPDATGVNGASAPSLLDAPEGLTFSGFGDMYIADTTNSRIVEVANASGTQWNISMTANDLYTVAGSQQNGTQGTSGDGGPATSALLKQPVAVQAFNNVQLYISDAGNNRIQEVARTSHTEWNIAMTANDIYTVAGSASGTAGFSGDSGLATGALLNNPGQVALDASVNMFIPDTNNNREREVSASTFDISEYAGDGQTLASMGDGGPAIDGELFRPAGQAEDASGNIYIADGGNNRIQEIAATTHTQWNITMTAGDVYTIAGSKYGLGGYSGDNGPAVSALLNSPDGIAVDAAGNLFIADQGNNRIREVNASTGHIATIAGNGTDGLPGNGGPATSAELESPQNVAVDSKGDVFIADNLSNEVREVFAAGGRSYGQTMTAGDIYRVAGSLSGTAGTSGDGGQATAALLNQPQGVAVDGAGNLYISDTFSNRIQEIPAVTGLQRGQQMTQNDIYTIAGSATGTAGTSGDGGRATAALLSQPVGLASDPAGDLFIADGQNDRIQEVPAANGTQWGTSMTGNDMYTVAGSASGTKGESGDGGPATAALMSFAIDVSVDSQGNLYISDWAGNHLREVTAATTPTITPAPGTTSALYPAPGGITITQPGGAQVTFYSQSGGQCTAPYVTAGQYCALPLNTGASLAFNSGTGIYTFTPQPGTSYTYNSGGSLTAEADAVGDTLTLSYGSPAPGSGNCPTSANWCETITSASGRALVLGYNTANEVTSVTDPMGRQWTYTYSNGDLTSAADPMRPTANVTTYGYGAGSTGNPLNANNLTTITGPNAQPGGPDAGDSTVNVYDSSGRVTQQTDPMGFQTSFNYCVNATAGDCMNTATGTGFTTITDPDGNTTVDSYLSGSLTGTADYTSGTTLTSAQTYVPDQTATGTSAGTQLDTATQDGNGNITTTTYDSNGNEQTSTAPDGVASQTAITTDAYTSLNNPSCSSTAEASTTCTASPGPTPVAPGGTIAPPSSVPPDGLTWVLYDKDGNELYTTTGVYQPGSSTAAYSQTTYQLFKSNTITLNGTNISCSASPPSPSLPCATINTDGIVTQLAYNTQGDLTSSSTPDGNPNNEVAATTYAYNGDGEQTSINSPDGNLSGVNAGNYTTVTAYNNDGQKTSVSQGDGSGHTVTPRVTQYGYDADGNQASVEDARGHTTTTAYNADDQATLVTNADGNSNLTCYDNVGNIVETVPAAGVAASNLTPASCPTSFPADYNPANKPLLATDATLDAYDADGNKTAEYTPASAGQTGYETTTYSYDANGNMVKATAPPASNGGSSQVTTDTYNSADELATETTGYGTSAASNVSYCYDPNGDTTSVVYADGNTGGTAPCNTSPSHPDIVDPVAYPTQAGYQTTYSYDSAGELVSTTTPKTSADPNGATTSSTYDPSGNMLTSTDPAGVTTTWTYTPVGQAATASYSGSSAHSVSFSYDASGNRTAMSDATSSSTYQYDPFGELTAAQNGAGQVTGYGYNPDGQVSSITYPLPSAATWATSDTVSYGYDNAGLLTSMTDFNGHQLTIGNTPDGMPTSVTLGSSGDTITTSYDPADAPSAIKLKNASSTLQSFTYTDAPSGNVLNEADTPASSQSPAVYTYDAKGRVTSMTPGTGSASSYGFDPSGNLTTLPTGATTTYDKAGELTSSTLAGTTTSYAYNADGEQLTSTQGPTTESQGTWNGAGQLTAYDNAAADMTAATYDGNGLRASTTITPAGMSAVTQGYVWNTQQTGQLLMDGANAYIYTTGIAPAEQINLSTGTLTYLTADRLGSVRGAVNSTGALTATTSYDAWGNPETAGGLTSTTPFGYAGGYTDPSGLVYLINRYYSPQTGQFISIDPDLASTLQPYAYAGDNPVSDTDPSGLRRGVLYQPQPLGGPVGGQYGWINITKMCTDNLKHCVLYWNTQFIDSYANATNISLEYSIGINGRGIENAQLVQYPHTLNGNQVPLFHGEYGKGKHTPMNKWGNYIYGCGAFGLFDCRGRIGAPASVQLSGTGHMTLNGQGVTYGFNHSWGKNKGKVQKRWKSVWIGAELPY